jgi:hypothetical protein
VKALLTSSAAALLTVIAPWLTWIWFAVPEWVVHTPPTTGVDPTRVPLVEKSSLMRMVGEGGGGGGDEGGGGAGVGGGGEGGSGGGLGGGGETVSWDAGPVRVKAYTQVGFSTFVPVIVVAVGSAIIVRVAARPPPLLHVPSPFVKDWTNPVVLANVPREIGAAALGQAFAHPAELPWSPNCWIRSRIAMR